MARCIRCHTRNIWEQQREEVDRSVFSLPGPEEAPEIVLLMGPPASGYVFNYRLTYCILIVDFDILLLSVRAICWACNGLRY